MLLHLLFSAKGKGIFLGLLTLDLDNTGAIYSLFAPLVQNIISSDYTNVKGGKSAMDRDN
jgi:hypothetical protein